MANTYNITVDKGATFTFNVQMRDSANANMLADATAAAAQVRLDPDSNTIVATFLCAFNGNNDVITVSMDEVQTANLDFSGEAAYWDLRVTWPTEIKYIVRGKFKVNDTVTR